MSKAYKMRMAMDLTREIARAAQPRPAGPQRIDAGRLIGLALLGFGGTVTVFYAVYLIALLLER